MKNTTETTTYETFLASDASNDLIKAYESHFENNTLTKAIEENNTPAMQEVKKEFGFMTTKKGTVEYAQSINLSVSNADIINPNKIKSVVITYETRNGEERTEAFNSAQSRVYSVQDEVKLTGAAWIGNEMIELTDEQIEFLTQEYK